jgi:adenosylmethionine-8-amino-7-oxononanoate aminotransferase
MGTILGERLARLQELPGVGDVRGLGMLWTMEFVRDKDTRKPWEQEKRVSERIFMLARAEGVLVYPMRGAAGEGQGDHVLIAPPFIVSEEEVRFLSEALEYAVRKAV